MTSSSADMDRNSTSMGPYCCRPGSGQYCTHGCSQRERKKERRRRRLRLSFLADDSQEKLIAPSRAVRGGEVPLIHHWLKTTGHLKCRHAWVGGTYGAWERPYRCSGAWMHMWKMHHFSKTTVFRSSRRGDNVLWESSRAPSELHNKKTSCWRRKVLINHIRVPKGRCERRAALAARGNI